MPKIAIIEDDADICFIYKMKLELAGYKVAVASDGVEGLEVIKTFQPHLVLLDLRMPRMGGDEMLSRLRDEDWGADIPVIILTNISRSEAPQALQFMTVERYITKVHFTPAQVVDVVRETLAKKAS